MKTKSAIQIFGPELKKLGFVKDYDSRAGGVRVVCYKKDYPDRQLELQLWLDGQYRVTNWFDGCHCTTPTYFKTILEMHKAIEHERTRSDQSCRARKQLGAAHGVTYKGGY